jgi:hypothetical protein
LASGVSHNIAEPRAGEQVAAVESRAERQPNDRFYYIHWQRYILGVIDIAASAEAERTWKIDNWWTSGGNERLLS